VISIQYAGTPALKTDFTRTGQRTKLGLLRDGYNSMSRYVKNNFLDGNRQDSIDLFLGNYQVEESEGSARRSPLAGDADWRLTILLTILLGCVFMFFTNVIVPSEYSTETLAYMLFWGLMAYGSSAVIFLYGGEMVQNPRLCPRRPRTAAATKTVVS